MEVFLARQPIFDTRKEVHAYELLYRNGYINSYNHINGDAASANVIVSAFQTFGLEMLTNGKPVFINFTENLIQQGIATILPRESLVIEVLETVEANQDTVKMCKTLKNLGYTLALDDFVYKPGYEPLLDLADIIKIDFSLLTRNRIKQLLNRLNERKVTLLAEKVETHKEFEAAKKLGFTLFQGYFFKKPEIVTAKAITPLQANYLQLISKVNQPGINFDELAKTLSRDVALTVSLLKLVNSAAFGFKKKVHSIKHALVLLGEKEIRKWISLLVLQNLGQNKPGELIRTSLVRARLAELIALETAFKNRSEDLFLAGLFSLLDVILDKPLAAILQDINAPDEVKACLLNKNDGAAEIGKAIIAYEQGRWSDVALHADVLKINSRAIIDAYLNALQWYSEMAA